MGWTFTNKGGQTTKEFFEREFNYEKPDGRSGKVLRCHATWTVAYMAYEIKVPATPEGPAKTDVIGLVCLIRHVPNDPDGYNFGYKDVSEDMGPCESRCPKTILDMLTPTTSEYALEWRKRCQERIDKRAKAPKVKAGDWLKFANPIRFVGGAELDTLCFRKGSTFAHYYNLYRLSNWRERDFVNLGANYKP